MSTERVSQADPAEWAISVAHDFKNLLFVITGRCQLLAQTIDADDPRALDLQAIMAASVRAETLAREVMAVGRGLVTPDRRLDPNVLVRGIAPLLRHLVGDQIRLDLDLAPELWPIRINATQLEQVLMNLVINARDAMRGHGVLTVTTANSGGERVVLSVIDTGTGLSQKAQARMFDPDYTTKKGGTGIGLATARAVVEANGGTIEVDSTLGVGTTMSVVLPRAGTLSQAAAAEAQTSAAGLKERILLIDDEPAIRYLLANCLRLEGYQLLLASTGREALDVYGGADHDIDLVVADINLPDMRGCDVAAELRKRHPNLGLVFISGAADSEDPSLRAFEAPLLTKPFSLGDLRRVLRQTLDARAAA